MRLWWAVLALGLMVGCDRDEEPPGDDDISSDDDDVDADQVIFATVAEVTALYEQWEGCPDLVDGQDLSEYVGDH